jgi:hypothetical protein
MEENLMAMSLLYALLDIDPDTFDFTIPTATGANLDDRRALKYHNDLSSTNQQAVRKALYDALYVILEYSHVTRTLSMAIGKVLCNNLKTSGSSFPTNDSHIQNLRENLQIVVRDAIDAHP